MRPLLEDAEPQVARALRAAASLVRSPDLGRSDLAQQLEAALRLDSEADAAALLAVEAEWLRYERPEETADVASLLPPGLHDLTALLPLLRTPRWKRLRLAPPGRA